MRSSLFEISIQFLETSIKRKHHSVNQISIITTVMSSYTFTLTGNSSTLSCNIFPEVILDYDSDYSCALLELTTYHSIPNVNDSNNLVQYFSDIDGKTPKSGPTDGVMQEFRLPHGSYEYKEILDYITESFSKLGFRFSYKVNENTFKTSVNCSTALYSGPKYSNNNIFKHIFGYTAKQVFPLNEDVQSNDIMKIASQDVVRVECNITSGSYVNGISSHSIYEFATHKVEVGHKIIERPKNLIYLPVPSKRLSQIQISLVDQNGAPIDFRGENITCRIHLKRD